MAAKNYWLMKTEPETFSIDDLTRVKLEPWTGVRNFQARNYMRTARVGDPVLFYHSSCPVPGVYGIGKVAAAAYPDPTQFDKKSPYYDPRAKKEKPLWNAVDVAFVRKLKKPVTLVELRTNKKLATMITLRPGNRLSVTPVSAEEFEEIIGK